MGFLEDFARENEAKNIQIDMLTMQIRDKQRELDSLRFKMQQIEGELRGIPGGEKILKFIRCRQSHTVLMIHPTDADFPCVECGFQVHITP